MLPPVGSFSERLTIASQAPSLEWQVVATTMEGQRVHLIPLDDVVEPPPQREQPKHCQSSLALTSNDDSSLTSTPSVSLSLVSESSPRLYYYHQPHLLQDFEHAADKLREAGAAIICNQALHLNRQLLLMAHHQQQEDSLVQKRPMSSSGKKGRAKRRRVRCGTLDKSSFSPAEQAALCEKAIQTKHMAVLLRHMEEIQQELLLEFARAVAPVDSSSS